MIYRAIGLMSGSSLDGLDIVYAEFREEAGKWSYEIVQADCYPYPAEWVERLTNAVSLPARDYQLLHAAYGHYTGQQVNRFIDAHQLHYKVSLIASHGHTTFHIPAQKMTAQLGDGAAIAAQTQLPVVTDLRSLDIAFGGQGAPIVPIGEKLLLDQYAYFLNLGGIANISMPHPPRAPDVVTVLHDPAPEVRIDESDFIAFDICPANRVLNMLANELGKEYDAGGQLAATGEVDIALLEKLNGLDYYRQDFPKSLGNDFGTQVVYPIIRQATISVTDALRTYTEHIAVQISNAVGSLQSAVSSRQSTVGSRQQVLVTGGGAFNTFLLQRLSTLLAAQHVEVIVPDAKLVNFKEALIMAFIGVLRWRQEYNVLSSVTGALRNSIGGALWTGQEA